MAAPTITPMNIEVKSSTTTSAGEKVKIRNLTRSQVIEGTFNNNGECGIAPHDTYTSWVSGDSIQVEVNGRLQGVKTATLATKGAKILVTTTAIAESASVSLSVNM